MIARIVVAIVLAQPLVGGPPTPGPTPTPTPTADLVAKIDELDRRRDDFAAFETERQLVEQAVAQAGTDYGVLWRAARMYFWASDDGGKAMRARSDLGKKGWDLAERAIKVKPGGVEGHYYAAICMGSYALGLGVVKALSIGLEGKFKERVGRAEQIDGRFDHGGIEVAWGRFYDKLPWPKRDAREAEKHFRKAIQINGANLRARAYLAESLLKEDRPADAKVLLDEIRRATVGAYDLPEEKKAKAIGAWLLPKVLDKLDQ